MNALSRKLAIAGQLIRWEVLREIFAGKVHNFKARLGRRIEANGNRVKLGDYTFSVATPEIPTHLKCMFVFDKYEKPERKAVKRFLDTRLPVIELGGGIGVVACHTNRMLRDASAHVVLEANPNLLSVLEENRRLNDCRFTIVHGALAYDGRMATFHRCENYLGSSVQFRGGDPVEVPAISLEQILEKFDFKECNLICDVEGAEGELFAREMEVLRRSVKILIVEIHSHILGEDFERRIVRKLRGAGFKLLRREKENYVFRNSALG